MGNNCCCSSCYANSQQDYADVTATLVRVEEMSHIDELISYIDQILNAINEGRANSITLLARTNRVASSINSDENLLQRSRHICKKNIISQLNRETRKIAIDVTNQRSAYSVAGNSSLDCSFWVGTIDQIISSNREGFILLSHMSNFAKYMKQPDDHLAQEKLNRVLQFIVQGSLFCISQMESHALSKFFNAPVAGKELRKLQAGLTQEYSELSMEAMIAVLNRIPIVLPPSQ